MKNEPLKRSFFERPATELARVVLGCVMVKKTGDLIQKGRIVEVEAYRYNDPACHAYSGLTKRAAPLFKKPGISYVYFIYGMHYCINVVAEKEGIAGGVLIRALEPIENLQNSNGPGKLTRAMGITKDNNENDFCSPESEIIIVKDKEYEDGQIIQTTRIGIKVAKDYPWRFYVKGNQYVSKK